MRTPTLILVALSLSACVGTTTPISTPVPAPYCGKTGVLANVVMDDKTRYAAEALYNVPANAYRAFNEAGRIPADKKPAIKDALTRAGTALVLVRSAFKLGDTNTFACQFSALTEFHNTAVALLPKDK